MKKHQFIMVNPIQPIWLATHVVIILGVIQGPELVLKQNQLLTVLPYIGREYIVTFELYLNSYPTYWASVLHFTANGNAERYGDRNPAVWLSGNKNHYRLIHISSSIDGNKNMWIDSKKIYPLKTWIKIRISQTLIDNKVLTSRV